MRARTVLLSWLLVAQLPSLLLAAPPSNAPSNIHAALQSVPAYAPDRILVRFKPGTPAASIANLHRQARTQTIKIIPGIDVRIIKVPPGAVQQKLKAYRANPNVEFAEPDYHRLLVLPTEGTDPPPPDGLGVDLFPEQWGLHNTGQLLVEPTFGIPFFYEGTPDADIDAPEAWDIHTGDSSIKLATLDTGIDCNAVDLASKCVEQISFVTEYSSTLDDIAAHGTHIAGIAAANSDNARGTAGVGWHTSIGNLKACYEFEIDQLPPLGFFVTVGVCPVSASAEAIIHAADNGYHVINMSYGSDVIDASGEPTGLSAPPNAETAAVSYAWSQGVVIVAAAGNDSDTTPMYPAAYDEVIAVAATDRYDNLASFSTFGNVWVSIMAPGENILSTEPDASCEFFVPDYVSGVDDCVTWKSGTSMASPYVAGAAALLWAQLYPGQTPSDCVASNGSPCNTVVRNILENSADASGALAQNFLAWSQHGRLNIFNMLSDGDGDSIISPADNCPDIANLDQTNTDGDSQGDACDADDDNDGLTDYVEVAWDGDDSGYNPDLDLNPLSTDTDNDGFKDGMEVAAGHDPLDPADFPVWGDINGSGSVDVIDVLLGGRAVLGLISLTGEQKARGNVAPLVGGQPQSVFDDEFTLADLLLIQRKALGVVTF